MTSQHPMHGQTTELELHFLYCLDLGKATVIVSSTILILIGSDKTCKSGKKLVCCFLFTVYTTHMCIKMRTLHTILILMKHAGQKLHKFLHRFVIFETKASYM